MTAPHLFLYSLIGVTTRCVAQTIPQKTAPAENELLADGVKVIP